MTTPDLRDAILEMIIFDWSTRSCTVLFRGTASLTLPGRYSLTFVGVAHVSIPARQLAGRSATVVELRQPGAGRYEIALQSGDTVGITAEGGPEFQTGPAVRRDPVVH